MRVYTGFGRFTSSSRDIDNDQGNSNDEPESIDNSQRAGRQEDNDSNTRSRHRHGGRHSHHGKRHLEEDDDNPETDRDAVSQYFNMLAQQGPHGGLMSRSSLKNTKNTDDSENNPAETGEPVRVTTNNLTVDNDEMPSVSGEPELDRWDAQIAAAAQSTGLPANFIKATLWAESRGNPDDPSQNPDGQHVDMGVMQISDYTYSDVMRNQPDAPRGLQAGNPDDNIMMGAWELKDKLETAGGDYIRTSEAYRGVEDGKDNQYANWVQTYWKELNNGQKLSDF